MMMDMNRDSSPSETFPFTRCLALRCTRGIRGLTTDTDRLIFAACNTVLHGTDAECAMARIYLETQAARIAELETSS